MPQGKNKTRKEGRKEKKVLKEGEKKGGGREGRKKKQEVRKRGKD